MRASVPLARASRHSRSRVCARTPDTSHTEKMFAVAPTVGVGILGLGRASTLRQSARISTSHNRSALVVRAARKGSPQSAQGSKKMSKGKSSKKNQECIEALQTDVKNKDETVSKLTGELQSSQEEVVGLMKVR